MINHILDHRNCTAVHAIIADSDHIFMETVVLYIILLYINIFNLFVVFITIGSAELRGCLFSMQLAASYVGNVLAGTSLLGNDIYYVRTGIPPLCQEGVDSYILLYFGTSMNMVIIVLNTRYRYNSIASIKNRRRRNVVRTKDVVLKAWLPTLFASCILCVVAMLVHWYFFDYQFLISIGITVLPLTFSVFWNVLLGHTLKLGRQNSALLGRNESIEVLDRATFIINVTIASHVAFLLVCSVTVACSLLYRNKAMVIGTSWLLRVCYLLLFTIEGHVYLFKVKPARDVIKAKFLRIFGCKEEGREEDVNLQLSNMNN